MIQNVEEINKWSSYNKLYVPEELNQSNYKYNYNGDYIIIRTNQNCRIQNNNQYCNCYYYNWKTNVTSVAYECNYTTTSNYTIAYNNITSDINYNQTITNAYFQSKSIVWFMFTLGILFALFLTKERKY